MKRDGRLVQTSDGPAVVFERTFEHPIDRVWSALTEPEEIRQWFVRTDIEPRVGGRIVEHHDHVGVSMAGEVTRFEPPRVFEHTWWADETAGTIMGKILWELFPTDEGGTRLVMTNLVLHPAGINGAMAGWHICLDILADVLGGGDPAAHAPPQGALADGRLQETAAAKGHWARREALEGAYAKDIARMA